MSGASPLESAAPPLVSEATGEHGRKFWCVRSGAPGNYYYHLYRQNILTASEDELSPAENVVNILAAEIQRLSEVTA